MHGLTGPIALAALLAALAACDKRQPKLEVPAEGIIELSDQFSSDFALIGEDGRAVADEDFEGKTLFVYFGFATCPDVCPLALGRMSASLNELTAAERGEIAPVFITVDPDRDTPERLKAYLAFDDRLIGLTGDRIAVEHAKQGFKVYSEPQPLADSALGYTMQHTSLFYLVDRKGRPRLALTDSLTPEELAEMLRRAIAW